MALMDWGPALRRRMVWDIVADEKIPSYSTALGLIPASPDVDQQEKVAAYTRLARLCPIGAPLTMLTELAGDVLARSLFHDHGQEPSEDDMEKINLVLQSGCHAVLAELIDLHVLTYGPAVIDLVDLHE